MSDEIDYKNIDLSSVAPGRAGIVFDIYYKKLFALHTLSALVGHILLHFL